MPGTPSMVRITGCSRVMSWTTRPAGASKWCALRCTWEVEVPGEVGRQGRGPGSQAELEAFERLRDPDLQIPDAQVVEVVVGRSGEPDVVLASSWLDRHVAVATSRVL